MRRGEAKFPLEACIQWPVDPPETDYWPAISRYTKRVSSIVVLRKIETLHFSFYASVLEYAVYRGVLNIAGEEGDVTVFGFVISYLSFFIFIF